MPRNGRMNDTAPSRRFVTGLALLTLSACASARFGLDYELALVEVQGADGSRFAAPPDRHEPVVLDGVAFAVRGDDRAVYLAVQNVGSTPVVIAWDDAYLVRADGGEARLQVGTRAREEHTALPYEEGAWVGETRALVLADRVGNLELGPGDRTQIIALPLRVPGRPFRTLALDGTCEEILGQRVAVVVPSLRDGLTSVRRFVLAPTELAYVPQDPAMNAQRRTCR